MSTIDFSKVFPRVKEVFDAGSEINIEVEGKTITLPEEERPVSLPFAENLVVCFALDEGNLYKFIQNRDLSEEVTIEKLYQAAMENMIEEIGQETHYQGDPAEVIMFTNGGNYEAALLLWNEFWESVNQLIGGPYYVAVPARDLLYLAPKSNEKAMEVLTQLISNVFDDEDSVGLMVRNIYERKDGRWELVATV